ncbi:NnrS family protein [Methylocystis parvus]|uniref:NnrS family protein n=1 Tax=Methylocystis parvus TaxID=134 RepID=A0A6B8M7F3_9HYPH|nr:NnrS family protein [Methylocystis parvus]QGM97579.1 NnrS family protein [Methylocystis parvus]WBJ98488.1 NnrS family protein [Methylocystis parvus OBBP]
MPAIPRYCAQESRTFLATFLSAGFRPFFLAAALWAAVALPLSIAYFEMAAELPTRFSPSIWHPHEMAFGFGGAVVAGFLLTAIPNWTGRMPLQGAPLAGLVALWLLGRVAIFFSASVPAPIAAALDLAFPAVFLLVVAREIVTGRNWRNLPMAAALALLFVGNMLTHLDAMNIAATGVFGARMGVATLAMLVALIGGRITPSFTRNWLAKTLPGAVEPAPFGGLDRFALAATLLALIAWVAFPDARATAILEIIAGAALFARLMRWRGANTGAEPLLFVLHLGYGWLALGLLFMGANEFLGVTDSTAPLHALTAGAIGTMTLAVMTRATRGHTGRALVADRGTAAIYVLVTLAAALRVSAPFTGEYYFASLAVAAGLWSLAYGLFALLYFKMLTGPRARSDA